uniref:RING-type domain-containing protein n=1 Tax=Esox lucius TaxID=8010 RepID=A0A3P8ZUR4_ESOLU
MEFPDTNTGKCFNRRNALYELVAGQEIVDLTNEVFTSSFVDLTNMSVDLTNNSNSVVVDPKCWQRHDPEQYVLSSDEEEEAVIVPDSPVTAAQSPSRMARSSETINCPICMDTYGEIVDGGRTLVSSQCGHLFCNICICESLAISQTCPTCRKNLNQQQCHPIYI